MGYLSEFVTTEQVRRDHGFSERTLKRRLAAGDVDLYRDPRDRRRYLIHVAQLDRLLEPRPFPRRDELGPEAA